LHFTIKTKHV